MIKKNFNIRVKNMKNNNKKRILYVIHNGTTGGTFLTNKDLMNNVEKDFEVYLLTSEKTHLSLLSFKNNQFKVLQKYPRNKKWSALTFNDSWLSYIYFDVLFKYKIDLVHIRHLINHSFDLPKVAKKLGIPIVLSMHDFYFICPFYTLLDENLNYCGGNCNHNNENCFNPLHLLENINSKHIISKWRVNVLEMFSNVDTFVTTSQIVKDLFLNIYDDLSIINFKNFKVIEHGRDFPKLEEPLSNFPQKDEKIKILCPANHLGKIKGSAIIKSIKGEDVHNQLEFHFLGNLKDQLEDYGISHGTYERDDFYKKVKEIKPHFIGIFSIWPETFCHTITEAWSCGIPVIGNNIGVIKDRITKENGGWIIIGKKPKESYEKIIQIGKNKKEYQKIQNNIRKMKLKTTKEMSDEYIKEYNHLLEIK